MAGGLTLDWQKYGLRMINSWLIRGNWFHSIVICWCLTSLTTSQGQAPGTVAAAATAAMSAGQCFQRPGIPKISFSCETGSIIKILRAFHGLRGSNREKDDVAAGQIEQQQDQQQRRPLVICRSPVSKDASCSFCEGDCVDESVSEVYDWSSCVGFESCIRTVMQSYMHTCPGFDKFSQYLQVEYQCTQKKALVNICEPLKRQTSTDGGWEISSPGYPGVYPPDVECTCSIRATGDPRTKLFLIFYDLFLETKDGRCKADWLMVQQGEEKHRHCGVITGGLKNVSLFSNSISLQFHSDSAEDNLSIPSKPQFQAQPFKGFWLRITADNQADLELSCERMVERAETEKSEEDSVVGSHARVITTTSSAIDEPITTESRDDGSGSANTRGREGSTPTRNNEILRQRVDEDIQQLERSPPLRIDLSQRQGQSSDGEEMQNLHKEIREAEEEDDHSADDSRRLKESSIFRADSLEVEDSPSPISKNTATRASLRRYFWQISSVFLLMVV